MVVSVVTVLRACRVLVTVTGTVVAIVVVLRDFIVTVAPLCMTFVEVTAARFDPKRQRQASVTCCRTEPDPPIVPPTPPKPPPKPN